MHQEGDTNTITTLSTGPLPLGGGWGAWWELHPIVYRFQHLVQRKCQTTTGDTEIFICDVKTESLYGRHSNFWVQSNEYDRSHGALWAEEWTRQWGDHPCDHSQLLYILNILSQLQDQPFHSSAIYSLVPPSLPYPVTRVLVLQVFSSSFMSLSILY